MRQPLLYKYNPSQCSPEELEATFVVREQILGSILDDLRARSKAPTNQHFLITGPRGIGKTNLLLMVRYRVAADQALSRAYIPVQTAEEEYSIATLRDFFAKALDLLGEAVTDDELTEAAKSVEASDKDHQAAELAIAALKAFCKRSQRKTLLLVDNFDLILGDQMADDAQIGRLRDVLMNESFLVLVAAAPTHFGEVTGYDRPFYNFFKPIDLAELSPDQMAELLRKRAVRDQNRTILDQFGQLRPRLRAVHHLTGGNPRLALMLYQLCTHTELPEVRDALQALLDDVTPYYKARLEELPPQQRKVMDTFARLGRAATPTELAAETRLPVNQINSILKRLRELGFVALPPQQRRKATYYIVSERVFRVWHQMRFSAASRRKLEFLIEFVRIWYTAQEWSSEADRLMQEYLKAATGRRFEEAGRFVEHLAYLAEAAPEPQKGHELADRTVRACIESGDFPRAERLLEERLASHSAQGDNARLAEDWFLKAYLSYAQGRWDDVIAELGQAVHFKPTFHDALGNWGAALTGLAVTKTGEERDRLFRQAFEKCEAAVKVKPDMHEALNNWGVALAGLAVTKTGEERERLFRQAAEKYEAAVKVKPDMHEALNNWGIALTNLAATKTGGERERLFQQAAEKCEAAVKVKTDMHDALANWGGALMEMASSKTGPEQQRLLQQAADRFEAALKVKPNDPDMLYQWGVALADMGLGETGRQQERLLAAASDKLDQAINISAQAVPSQSRDLWAVQFVQVALARCAHALDANNVGHARSLFIAALDRLSGAEHASAKNEMLFFFRWATHETRADSCAELFSLMRERKMERELALLEPFVLAVEYWQKGKDAQVLDRLNPELRQLVEAIIKGPAAKKEDSR